MKETGVKLCTRGWSPRSRSCVSPNTKRHPTKLSAAVWAGAACYCGSLTWLRPRFPAGSQPRVPLRESPLQGGLGTHGDRHAQKERTHSDGPEDALPRPALISLSGSPGRPASPQVCAVGQGDGRLPHRAAAGRTVAAGEIWESGLPPGRKTRRGPDKGRPRGGIKCSKCFACGHSSTSLVSTEPGTTPSAPLGPFTLLETTQFCQLCPLPPASPPRLQRLRRTHSISMFRSSTKALNVPTSRSRKML